MTKTFPFFSDIIIASLNIQFSFLISEEVLETLSTVVVFGRFYRFITKINTDLEVAHPHSCYSSTIPGPSSWNLKLLVFEEKGKPENPEKKLSGLRRGPITNSTHIPGGLLPMMAYTGWDRPRGLSFSGLRYTKG